MALAGGEGLVRAEIARCPYFVVEKLDLDEEAEFRGHCDGTTFEIWGCVAGAAQVAWAGNSVSLAAVRFVLLPAALGEFAIQAEKPATLLRAYAPE